MPGNSETLPSVDETATKSTVGFTTVCEIRSESGWTGTIASPQRETSEIQPPHSDPDQSERDPGKRPRRSTVFTGSYIQTKSETSVPPDAQEISKARPGDRHVDKCADFPGMCQTVNSERTAVPLTNELSAPDLGLLSDAPISTKKVNRTRPTESLEDSPAACTTSRKTPRRRGGGNRGDSLPEVGEAEGTKAPACTPSLNSPPPHQLPEEDCGRGPESACERNVELRSEADRKPLHFSFSQLESLGSDKDSAMAISNLLTGSGGEATTGEWSKLRRSLSGSRLKKTSVPSVQSPSTSGRKSEPRGKNGQLKYSEPEPVHQKSTHTPLQIHHSHAKNIAVMKGHLTPEQKTAEERTKQLPIVICTGCGIIFATKKTLSRHHRLLRCKGRPVSPVKILPIEKKQETKNPKTPSFVFCPQCGRRFNAKKSMVRHLKNLCCKGLSEQMLPAPQSHGQSAEASDKTSSNSKRVLQSSTGIIDPISKKWFKNRRRHVVHHRRFRCKGGKVTSTAPPSYQPDTPAATEVLSSQTEESSVLPTVFACPNCGRTFKAKRYMAFHKRYRCKGRQSGLSESSPNQPSVATPVENKTLARTSRQTPVSGQEHILSQIEAVDKKQQMSSGELLAIPSNVRLSQNRAGLRPRSKSCTPAPPPPLSELRDMGNSATGDTVIESAAKPRLSNVDVSTETGEPLSSSCLEVVGDTPVDRNREINPASAENLTTAIDPNHSPVIPDADFSHQFSAVKDELSTEQLLSHVKINENGVAVDDIAPTPLSGGDDPVNVLGVAKFSLTEGKFDKQSSCISAGSSTSPSHATSAVGTADKDTNEASNRHVQSDVVVVNGEDEGPPAPPDEVIDSHKARSPAVDCNSVDHDPETCLPRAPSQSSLPSSTVDTQPVDPECSPDALSASNAPLKHTAPAKPLLDSGSTVVVPHRKGRPRRDDIRFKGNAQLGGRTKYGGAPHVSPEEAADSLKYEYSCNLDKHLPRLRLHRKVIVSRAGVSRRRRRCRKLLVRRRRVGIRRLGFSSPTSSTGTEPQTVSGSRTKYSHSGEAEDNQSTASDLTSLSSRTIPATTISSHPTLCKPHPTYVCPGCRRGGFATYRAAFAHRNRCHAGTQSRLPPVPEQIDSSFTCSYCGRQHKSIIGLRVHRAACARRHRTTTQVLRKSANPEPGNSNTALLCPGCGPKTTLTFTSTETILSHLHRLKASTHPSVGRPEGWPSYLSVPNLGFGCHICGLLLASESRLDKHKRAQHEAWLHREAHGAVSPNGLSLSSPTPHPL